MCATCDKAKKLPAKEGLKLLADAMKKGRRDCLDKMVGLVIGVSEGEQDTAANEAWERRRR